MKDIAPNSMDALQKYDLGWSLLLLSILVERLADDGAAERNSRQKIELAYAELQAAGVRASSPKSLALLKTTEIKETFSVPNIYSKESTSHRITTEVHVRSWVNYLESVCKNLKSGRQHLLFFDGLDDTRAVLSGRSLLLAGLIQALDRLNSAFRQSRAPIKLLLACRTDVFARIDLPQHGKIRNDFGLEINWYQNPRNARQSNLNQLVNTRGKIVDRSIPDVIQTFFPSRLLGRGPHEATLEQTRHTPRDLLQLLKIVQRHVTEPGPIPEEQVLSGFTDYSNTYFSDEAHDGLRFYFDEAERRKIMDLLGTFRRRTFDLSGATAAAKNSGASRLDLKKVLSALFDTGFIGNITRGGPTDQSSSDYYRFSYRNVRASVKWDEEFVLHYGLWKALNVA